MAQLKTGTEINSNVVIHQGNDNNAISNTGGVNAATLDGNDSSDFATSDHGHDGTYSKIGSGATGHDGNIYTDGNNIYIRANEDWKQVFPAVYS